MARKRNPNRDLAYELFKNSKGKLTCKAIAEQLNEKESFGEEKINGLIKVELQKVIRMH